MKTSSRAMRSEIRIEFLEVVAVPGHERAQHVAPERQLAELGRGTVGDDVTLHHRVAHAHQRPLVDAGRLVGAHELAQPVDVHALGRAVLVGRAHHDARAVDLVDHAGAARDDRRTQVTRHRGLHAGADERRVRADQRHGLALHVGAHQRAVGIVVLEERDQGRGDGDELLRRDVDRRHILGLDQAEITLLPDRNEILREAPVGVHRRVRLRDDKLLLLHSGEVARLLLHHAVLDQHVRGFDEPVLVDLGVGRERVDQADIRPFRRLDRADAAVMRGVHVAHLEARALARETARTERGKAALVRHFRERVGLVHELAELARAKELAHRRRRRLRVDEVVRHHRVDIDRAHALADRPLHAQQADAILVLHQLADRAHPAVAEIVDVVDLPAPVLELAEHAHRRQDVFLAQHSHAVIGLDAEAHVHLHAPDRREIVTIRVEEHAAEQRLRRFRRRRLTGAHDSVHVHQRVLAPGALVDRQRVADPRPVRLVDRERRQSVQPRRLERGELRLGQFLAGLGPDLAGIRVDQVLGDEPPDKVGLASEHRLCLLGDLARGPRGHFGVGVSHHLAALGVDQRLQQLGPSERLRIERPRPALRRAREHHLAEKEGKDLLGVHAADLGDLHLLATHRARGAQRLGRLAVERIEQRGDWQLTLAVDADVDEVLAVELEVEPGAAIGDDARGEEILAGAVRLALVVVEEDARAAVHLAHDHALGTVDDERAVVRHQRHVAHVDGLFLDVADRARACVLVEVPDDQAQDHLQRGREGQAALDALLDVVFRLLELVGDELEPAAPGEVIDREDGGEHLLQPGIGAAVRRRVHLQERFVGSALHVDEIGHRHHFGDAPEGFADTLASRERPRNRVHASSGLSRCRPARGGRSAWSSRPRLVLVGGPSVRGPSRFSVRHVPIRLAAIRGAVCRNGDRGGSDSHFRPRSCQHGKSRASSS